MPTGATTRYSVGSRLRIMQNTGGTKYGIITSVTSTTITVFFQSGVVLNNELIYNPYFSREKAPFGFPLEPNSWTIELTLQGDAIQNSAVTGTWYNPSSSLNLLLGVGNWDVKFEIPFYVARTTSGEAKGLIAISSSASSVSFSGFVGANQIQAASSSNTANWVTVSKQNNLTLTSQTQLYLIVSTPSGADRVAIS